MSPMIPRLAILGVLLLVGVGCSSSYRYEMQVINNTKRPLSVGPVLPGSQVVPGWTGPEHIAISAPQLMDQRWGATGAGPLLPGEALYLVREDTPFAQRGRLRVYDGDRTIKDLVSISDGDPDRVDILVFPGRNAFIINSSGGRLTAQPTPWQELPPRSSGK